MSDLYLEAHITVEPNDEFGYDTFKRLSDVGWKASKFDHDDVDGIAGKWFLSYASDDRADICAELMGMVHGLEGSGFTVLRWKLEETILDSKDEGAHIDDLIKLGRIYGE